MKKCSEIIRELREDHDLNQKTAAKIIHTSQQQYSKYENGYVEIPLRGLVALADYYGVSADYLLGRAEHTASTQTLDTYLSSNAEIATMLSTMQQLSPESQSAIFEYVSLQALKEKSNKGDSYF